MGTSECRQKAMCQMSVGNKKFKRWLFYFFLLQRRSAVAVYFLKEAVILFC
jgi:hypothetical protein